MLLRHHTYHDTKERGHEDAAKRYCEALGLNPKFTNDPKWPLPNLKRANEANYWSWRADQGFKADAWAGQIRLLKETAPNGFEYANLLIDFVDRGSMRGGGFAVLVFRDYQKERVEYYTWSKCDHKWVEKNVRMCLHRYTCEHCKEAYEIDSSD